MPTKEISAKGFPSDTEHCGYRISTKATAGRILAMDECAFTTYMISPGPGPLKVSEVVVVTVYWGPGDKILQTLAGGQLGIHFASGIIFKNC